MKHFDQLTTPSSLETDLHSLRLIAAYQVLVDVGIFTEVQVVGLSEEKFNRLYGALTSELSVSHEDKNTKITPHL